MLNTFRSQILFVITNVMLITAVSILFVTHKDVKKAVVDVQKKSNQNIFEFIDSNIRDEYNELLLFKADTVKQLKSNIKSQASLCKVLFQASTISLKRKSERSPDKPDGSPQKKINLQWINLVKQWVDSPLRDKKIDWLVFDDKSGDIFFFVKSKIKKSQCQFFSGHE